MNCFLVESFALEGLEEGELEKGRIIDAKSDQRSPDAIAFSILGFSS